MCTYADATCFMLSFLNGMAYCHAYNTLCFIISAFTCIARGKPFLLPRFISLTCIKSAERIVNTSYSQAEVYSSVSMQPKAYQHIPTRHFTQ